MLTNLFSYNLAVTMGSLVVLRSYFLKCLVFVFSISFSFFLFPFFFLVSWEEKVGKGWEREDGGI